MLTAVWTVLGILKIIGLVLLGIAGFLLAVLFLVLLVPIRYQAQIKYDGRADALAGVSWLCHLLAVKAVYKEKLAVRVRILGICVFRTEKAFKKGKAEGARPDGETAAEDTDTGAGEPGSVKTAGNISEEGAGKEAPAEVSRGKAGEEAPSEEARGEPAGEAPVETAGKKPSPANKEPGRKKKKQPQNRGFSFPKICDKLKEKLRRIKEALMGIKEKKEKLEAFVKDPANRRTYHLLKRQLRKLFRHVLPVKASGRVRFGLGDPYKTGQVLTYLSPFYGLYAQKLQIIPSFEEAVLEGEGRIKGRIRIGTVLVLAARMLFDKNFRALLKKILKA